VNLVLDEKVDERDQSSKERSRKRLSVLDSSRIRWAQGKAAKSPWKRSHQVGDHEDVVPVMVIGRSNISPSSAGEGAEYAHEGNELWKLRIWTCGQQVPEANEEEAGAFDILASEVWLVWS